MFSFKCKIGQWRFSLAEDSFRITNPGEDGKSRFFSVEMGQYSPFIIAEPELAFYPPEALTYVDAAGNPVEPDEKIAGIICGKVHRFSLTSAKMKGIEYSVNKDGSLTIDGKVWWITGLFSKYKNLIVNYDAFCSPEKPDRVMILELADLAEIEIFK